MHRFKLRFGLFLYCFRNKTFNISTVNGRLRWIWGYQYGGKNSNLLHILYIPLRCYRRSPTLVIFTLNVKEEETGDWRRDSWHQHEKLPFTPASMQYMHIYVYIHLFMLLFICGIWWFDDLLHPRNIKWCTSNVIFFCFQGIWVFAGYSLFPICSGTAKKNC